MSSKVIILFCAQALFAHVAFSQCIRSGGQDVSAFIIPSAAISPCGSQRANSLGYGGFGFGSGLGIGAGIGGGFAGAGSGSAGFASGGGAFPIESLTPIAPNGIAVTSENGYEGALGVVGELPFLSTVALKGVLPSAGVGIVNHGYGNGITAITSEIDGSAGLIGAGGIGSGIIGAGGIGSGLIGAGGIGAGFGSGIIGAGGIGSGIIGATGIGSGAFGNGLGTGGINGFNFGQTIGRGCGCY